MATSQEFSKVVTFNQNAGGINFFILGTSTSQVTFNGNGTYTGVWIVYSDCWFTTLDENNNIIYDGFGQPLNRWYYRDNGGNGTFSGTGDQYTFNGRTADGVTAIYGTGTFSNNRTIVNEAITLDVPGIGLVQGNGYGHYDTDVIGDSSDNTINGDTGFDHLEGAGGNDHINGDLGNDYLQGDDGNDTLVGGNGNDELHGGVGNDALYIGQGSDIAYGGDGTDTVYISGALADYSVYTYSALTPVSDSITSSNASVSSTKHIQLLDKDGNSFNFSDAETIVFGENDQTLSIDNNGLLKGSGSDKKDNITGSATADFIYSGESDDKVYGKDGSDEINGGAGKDSLDGGLGNDRLDGATGDDVLTGGAGNDTYIVNSTKDKVTEKPNQGLDTVISTATYTLANNIEDLSLSGTAVINATGNALANTLVGNTTDNTINGASGNDTLTGGQGNDTFAFNSKLGASNIDTITDFTSGADKIALDDAIFIKIKGMSNLTDNLYIQSIPGISTQDSNDYLFYDFESGRLYYDADGSGAKSVAVVIAIVGSATEITAVDFVIV